MRAVAVVVLGGLAGLDAVDARGGVEVGVREIEAGVEDGDRAVGGARAAAGGRADALDADGDRLRLRRHDLAGAGDLDVRNDVGDGGVGRQAAHLARGQPGGEGAQGGAVLALGEEPAAALELVGDGAHRRGGGGQQDDVGLGGGLSRRCRAREEEPQAERAGEGGCAPSRGRTGHGGVAPSADLAADAAGLRVLRDSGRRRV